MSYAVAMESTTEFTTAVAYVVQAGTLRTMIESASDS